jgi:hypothetical protein
MVSSQTIGLGDRDVAKLDANTHDTAHLVAQAQASDAADRKLTIWQAVSFLEKRPRLTFADNVNDALQIKKYKKVRIDR